MVEKTGKLSEFSFIRVLMPFLEPPPSYRNHLPKASPLNTITLGIRFQYMGFGGQESKAIQSEICVVKQVDLVVLCPLW